MDNSEQKEQNAPKKAKHTRENNEPPSTIKDTGDSQWDIIIVNQIPRSVGWLELMPVFSSYGKIKNVYFPMPERRFSPSYNKNKGFARITFTSETDARRVWEDSLKKLIKYKVDVLMITLVSEEYSPIENLPDDCLREIFLRLTCISEKLILDDVCRRWRKVGAESWSNITEVRHIGNMPMTKILSRAGNFLRNVEIGLCQNAKEIISVMLEHCMHLENVQFDVGSDMTSYAAQLDALFDRNEHLRRLSMEFHRTEDLSFLQHLSTRVEEIELKSRKGSIPLVTAMDLSKYQNLQIINLLDFQIGENQFEGIENLVNLKKLKLNACNVHPSNIEKMMNFTQLEFLAIPNCQISDSTLSIILKNNMGLKYLNISGIHEITDSSFKYVQRLPELQILMIDNVTTITDTYLCNMPKLRGLSCSYSSITEDGLRDFLETAADIRTIYAYDCVVTMRSALKLRQWADDTGRRLELLVDDILFWQCGEMVNFESFGNLNIGRRKEAEFEEWYPVEDVWTEYLLD